MDDEESVYVFKDEKCQPINFHMLVKRHLPPDATKTWTQQEIFDKLNCISHVRLDRERIREIDGLELFGKSVTNLYLQCNSIEKIDNLENLTALTFLTLGSNNIQSIQGLSHLNHLGFLDLSMNKIESFDLDELPSNLVILDLRGNPCTEVTGYRQRLIQDLPKLRQLDGQEVSVEERRQAGYDVPSDSEEDSDQNESDTEDVDQGIDKNTYIQGIFKSTRSDILERAAEQMSHIINVHQVHMDILDSIRSQSQMDFTQKTSSHPQTSTSGDVSSVQRLESLDSRSQSSGSRSAERSVDLDQADSAHSVSSCSPDAPWEDEDSDGSNHAAAPPSIVLSPFGMLPQSVQRPHSGSRLGSQHAPLGPINHT